MQWYSVGCKSDSFGFIFIFSCYQSEEINCRFLALETRKSAALCAATTYNNCQIIICERMHKYYMEYTRNISKKKNTIFGFFCLYCEFYV